MLSLTDSITNPKKRIFYGYLLAAILIALFWLRFACRLNWRQSVKQIFARDIWWSSSAKADYGIFFINKIIFLFITPLFLTQLAVANWLFQELHTLIGFRPELDWAPWVVKVTFTLTYFLLDDFSRFYTHKLLHEVPVLWAFHKTHHSARVLTPLTVFRTHPVEGIIFAIRGALVQGVCMAVFIFFFGITKVDLLTVIGVSAFSFIFNIAGSNLRHTHVGLCYPDWLEKILISPAQHQIHHSVDPQHFNKNYGVVLSIWDRFTGTIVLSKPSQSLNFGLSRKLGSNEQRLDKIYLAPFAELLSKASKKAQIIISNRH